MFRSVQAGFFQRVATGHAGTLVEGLALADHHGGHMGQRREIARSADGALFRDHRGDALVQHGLDQADQLDAHARSAAAERNELQRHDQPDDVIRQRRTNAAAMRQDEISLQLR